MQQSTLSNECIVPGVDSSLFFKRRPHCNTTVVQKNVLDVVGESLLGAILLLKQHTYAQVRNRCRRRRYQHQGILLVSPLVISSGTKTPWKVFICWNDKKKKLMMMKKKKKRKTILTRTPRSLSILSIQHVVNGTTNRYTNTNTNTTRTSTNYFMSVRILVPKTVRGQIRQT